MSGCPKCNNSIGFVFGTCTSCGWNKDTNKWGFIHVVPDRLPLELREALIQEHEFYYGNKK